MGLDGGGRAFDGNGFDHVRIQGSLHQEANFAVRFPGLKLAGGLFEYGDEFPADPFALFFRVGNAFQLCEEAVGGIDADDMKAEAFAIHGERVFKFVFAKQARVDEDVGQSIADGFVHEDGGNCGIHPAAQAADGPSDRRLSCG